MDNVSLCNMEYPKILPFTIFQKRICHTIEESKRNIFYIVTQPMLQILEYGIFWNMEYFRIWNILKYSHKKYFRNISVISKISKTIHLFTLSVILCSIFWNMERLQYGLFCTTEYFAIRNIRDYYHTKHFQNISIHLKNEQKEIFFTLKQNLALYFEILIIL